MTTKKNRKLTPGVVAEIPIDQLQPDATQPRQAFRAKPLQELADNIKARGIKQPITVTIADGGEIWIKTGERRWRAAKLAGLKTVPCLLDAPAAGDALVDRLFDQLCENDLREDLNPIERAEALARLKTDKLGPSEISKELERHGIHMARSTVSNLLRLLNLPDAVQDLVRDGRLKESYARDLLQFVDHPNILDAFAKNPKATAGEIDKETFAECLDHALEQHAEAVGWQEEKRCKDCKCLAKAMDPYQLDEVVYWCLDPETIKKKRADREKKPAAAAETPKPAKKVETDPTKAKPVKVKESDEGVVATNRRSYTSYNDLSRAGFDKTPCEGCPHKHLASYNGKKLNATETCFYPPCFQNLKRQHSRIANRRETIREMIDEQCLPVLVGVASRQPLGRELLTPLLAFHAASNEAKYYGGLQKIEQALNRRHLTDWLQPALLEGEVTAIVAELVAALPKERRHELALHLSMQVTDWWHNTEDFAKLFVKAELKEMCPNYDPPDVTVGEWRDRLVNEVKTPAIVVDIWNEDWSKKAVALGYDDGADSCRRCGCTEFDPCDGGCHWVEPPDMEGLGLCSSCVDEEQAAA